MLSKRILYRIRFFAIISFTTLLAACGEGTGPTPVAGAPCPTDAVLSFDADSYPESAASASISLSDSCVGYKTVSVNVDNGTDSISVSITLDSRGSADPATLNFGTTDDATDTISIAEGDVITVSYTGANGVNQTDTASITETSVTLGVYSETNIDPVLNYSQITNAADLGGYVTTTTEVTTDVVVPLEGNKSLQAVFETDNPLSGTYNGFAFSFVGSIGTGANDLINPSFEIPDASAGDIDCVTVADGGSSPTAVVDGWECFNGAFVASNLFKPGGPDDVQNPTAIDGSQIMKLFNADGIARQSITVAAGDNVHASVYGMNWSGDEFNNLFILQLAFFDASDTQIGVKEVTANTFDDGTLYQLEPKDGGKATDWTLIEVSEVAPAGTVRAQILQLHVLTDGTPNTGSIALDAARLYAGAYDPAPPLVDSGDIATYDKLKFAINSSAASSLMELEVKMEDTAANSASVFLSAYTPAITGDWSVYEIPLDDFGSVLDKTVITSLGFYNPSTVVNTDASYPALFAATLYFDDVHFVKKDTGPAPLTGVLIDAAVEGVTYSTATQSGITNVDGEFSYFTGEMVTFSVGGIVLGTVEGASIITPVELTGGGNPVDQTAINQLVFLQSIDEDQDPSNGITISAATRAAAAALTLDFTLDSAAFTTAVTAVVNAITPAPGNALVSEKTALDNFYVTYTNLGGTDTVDWSFPPLDYPAYPGSASFPVDFEDAGAPYFFSNFEGGVATVVANVKPTGNASAKVAQMQKFSGQPFGGSTLTLGEIAYANGTVFTMKVWASREVPVTLKLEGANVEKIASHTGSGTWEELVFVFDGINAETGAGARAITLIFDNGVNGNAANDAANWTFYFDDINLVSTDPAKYQLIFSDEFDGSTLDTANWTIETGYGDGGWGNNEWQNYTADSVKVEDGNLVITADCATAPNCGVRDGSVTSGRINTLGKFSFKYGIAEARIKAPVQKAAWPAFWMLGNNYPDVGWPFSGEVDIMELFAYQSDDKTTHAAIHWCDETVVGVTPTVCFPTGWKFVTQERSFDESLGDDFHVFSAQWNEDRIIAKIDGIEYFSQAIDPATMDEFLKEFFLILNVAVGGSLGSGDQAPDGTEVWPQTMLVDYVRVYQLIPASAAETTISLGAASAVADGSATTVTVQAKDASGNNFIKGGDVVVLTTDGDATFSGTGVVDNGDGSYTANDVGDGSYTATISNLTAEQVIVSGTINGVAISGTDSADRTIDFLPGVALPADSTITSSDATPVAGTTATITVTVVDANGNLTAGDVGLVTSSASGSAALGTTTSSGIGVYTATLDNLTAEEVTVSATVNTIDIGNVIVNFVPGEASAAKTTIVAAPSVVKNDGMETSIISVQAKDANGNNLTTGTDTVLLSTNDSNLSANLTSASYIGNGLYQASISNTDEEVLTISGTINGVSITGSLVVPMVSFEANPPSPANTSLVVSAATAIADGTTIDLTVQAADAAGDPLTGGGAMVILNTELTATISGTGVVDNGGGSYTAFDEGDGTYSAMISSTVAGPVTVNATINGSEVGIDNDKVIDFTPGPADVDNTIIALDKSSIFADDTETSTITVQARDFYGNDLRDNTVTVIFTTNDITPSAVSPSVTVSPASYVADGLYQGTIKNSEVESLEVGARLDGAAITTAKAPISFTPPFSVDNTTMTVSFDTAALANGTNTSTLSTITVQAIDGSDAPLGSSPGVLTLQPDSTNAIISGTGVLANGDGTYTANDVGDGTYTATISNPAAEIVTITGDIDGRTLTDFAVVTFGSTVSLYSENNKDSMFDVIEIVDIISGCNLTEATDVDAGTYTPLEGNESKQVIFTNTPTCNGFDFNFGPATGGSLPAYSADFESPLLADMPANTDIEGFVIGNIVNDGAGWFPGTFGAPANYNNGYSRIVPGEGDAPQGEQQLSIFNDYNTFSPFAAGGPGTKVQAFVTYEVGNVGAGDDGVTYRFSFDTKLGNIEDPWQAEAFVKVLKSSDGSFIELANNVFDSDAESTVDWDRGFVDLVIDTGMIGELVQIGFNSTSVDYGPTGVFYDNLDFSPLLIDLSGYKTLKFAIDSSLAVTPALLDLEVKLIDSAGGTASVFLSDYIPTPTGVAVWNVYEIPVTAFLEGGTLDETAVQYLGFRNATSDKVGDSGYPSLLNATLYFDDIHFIETPPPSVP